MADPPADSSTSIDDLPQEVLEMLASHLPLSSIGALRCVNRYFNRVFADIFWKGLLCFPEKQFLLDLHSSSTATGVKDIVEEISQGTISKWHGYYKLQRAHIKNWMSGLPDSYDVIPLSLSDVWYMEEIVDDYNEHWVFFSVGESIHIWNITAEPRALEPVTVGPHTDMKLLSQGKMLIRDLSATNKCVVAVYKFENPTYDLHLQYKIVFYMDEVLHPNMHIPEISCNYFHYIAVKNYLIGYDSSLTKDSDLHIWDLKSGFKLAQIDLRACDYVKAFMTFMYWNSSRIIINDEISYPQLSECEIDILSGEFPNIIVILRYKSSFLYHKELSQVNIFNLVAMQFTCLVDQVEFPVYFCSMHSDKISMEKVIFQRPNEPFLISGVIYIIHKKPVSWVPFIHNEVTEYVPVHAECIECIQCSSNGAVVLKGSKMLLKSGNEVHVVSLDTEPLHHTIFNVDLTCSFIGFVEPNLLLLEDLDLTTDPESTKTDVKVYNSLNGREMCTWKCVDIRFMDYILNVANLSKVILNVDDKPEFRIFSF